VVKGMLRPGPARDRLTFLCPDFEGDKGGIAEVEQAFIAKFASREIYKKLKQAQRNGHIKSKLPMPELFEKALEKGIINDSEFAQLQDADAKRLAAINVNDFDKL
jgi:acyl-CoA dehydrogenase